MNKSMQIIESKDDLIKPFVGLSIKEIKFNNVDFPEPEGPISE